LDAFTVVPVQRFGVDECGHSSTASDGQARRGDGRNQGRHIAQAPSKYHTNHYGNMFQVNNLNARVADTVTEAPDF
jgi:hypothetical protein